MYMDAVLEGNSRVEMNVVSNVQACMYYATEHLFLSIGDNRRSCCHCSAELCCHGDPGRAGGTSTALAQERRSEEKISKYVCCLHGNS